MTHIVAERPTKVAAPVQMPIASNQKIHIINPFWDASGGSELHAISIFEGLRPYCNVSLWSEYDLSPQLMARYPIQRISGTVFPKTGVFVFLGAYFPVGTWTYFTWPRRVVLVHNTPLERGMFTYAYNNMSVFDHKKVEIVYVSQWLADLEGFAGRVVRPLIDIDPFMNLDVDRGRMTEDFVVGRLSRDVAYKHHANDPALYLDLASRGFQIKIMGGMCLSNELAGAEQITLLPVCVQEPHIFLQSLDCFFYRTSEAWMEPFGRVVVEAMACGLPVVVEDRGGYAEVIDHGRNGFLFRNDQEALDILLRLKHDRHLCRSIGTAARATVEELYSPARRWEILQYYLQ